MSERTRRDLNEYLFYEFGEDGDPADVADDWPSELRPVGRFAIPGGETEVFEFTADGERYFAVTHPGLNFYPAADLTPEDVRLQMIGAAWIGDRDPIDLDTSRIGDDSVPPVLERRAAIERLASVAFGQDATAPRILEGLFLRRTGEFLALIESPLSPRLAVVGTKLAPRLLDHRRISAWQQLVIAVGQLLDQKVLLTEQEGQRRNT